MNLTSAEIRTLLKLIAPPSGGYSHEPEISHLQAKLSMMLEVAEQMEALRKARR